MSQEVILDLVCDLFDRWAKLEPERCKPWATEDTKGEHRKPFDTNRAVFLSHTGWWNVNPKSLLLSGKPTFRDLEEHDIAVLQRAVQQAIATRPEWGFQLHLTRHINTGEPAYFGIVDRGDGKEISSPDFSDPAIALLDAYVQALEATAGGGKA